MATQVVMPKLSPTMEEGQISRWLKNEGDKVSMGEPLAEIDTDKATMEMQALGNGVLRKISSRPARAPRWANSSPSSASRTKTSRPCSIRPGRPRSRLRQQRRSKRAAARRRRKPRPRAQRRHSPRHPATGRRPPRATVRRRAASSSLRSRPAWPPRPASTCVR